METIASVLVSDLGKAVKSALATDKSIEHFWVEAYAGHVYISGHTRYAMTVVRAPADGTPQAHPAGRPITRESLEGGARFFMPGTKKPWASLSVDETGITLLRNDTQEKHRLHASTTIEAAPALFRLWQLRLPQINWDGEDHEYASRVALAPGIIKTLASVAQKVTDPIIIEPGLTPSDPVLFRIGEYALVLLAPMHDNVPNLNGNTKEVRDQWNSALDAMQLINHRRP